VAQQPIAIAGSKGLPVFQNTEAQHQQLAHCRHDDLFGIEATSGFRGEPVGDDVARWIHRKSSSLDRHSRGRQQAHAVALSIGRLRHFRKPFHIVRLVLRRQPIGVGKLLFLGSSCIYPKLAPQPMGEEMLLTGPLEPTNEWYAVAKIADIKLVEAYRRQYGADFISLMPTNLYGPGDNYHREHSHVPAALIRRFHEAKLAKAASVSVWGTGRPRREFLAVDDLADACVFVLKYYSDDQFLNVGTQARPS
jgi:hypothetical protein